MRVLINHLGVAALFSFSLLLTACGGSSGGSSSSSGDQSPTPTPTPTPTAQVITGTAATGAAIDGSIYLSDSTGQPGDGVPFDINADGTFEIDVSTFVAPFLLKAVPDDGSATQFSFAEQAGVANITPLTTLALFEATQRADLSGLFESWSQASASFDVSELEQTAAAIAASLQAEFSANGVDPTAFDLFSSSFSANNTGFDAVLDATDVVIDLAGGTVSVNGNTFEIPTDLPDIPDVPGGSDWTLVVTGQVNGFSIPETRIENLPAPTQAAIETQFVEQSLSSAPGTECSSIAVNSVTNTDTRVVFTLQASCTLSQQGVSQPFSYDLTYTYTR